MQLVDLTSSHLVRDCWCVGPQADLFEYLCLEHQQRRRDVELDALEPQLGSDPLTPPQLAQLQDARHKHQQMVAAKRRQDDVDR